MINKELRQNSWVLCRNYHSHVTTRLQSNKLENIFKFQSYDSIIPSKSTYFNSLISYVRKFRTRVTYCSWPRSENWFLIGISLYLRLLFFGALDENVQMSCNVIIIYKNYLRTWFLIVVHQYNWRVVKKYLMILIFWIVSSCEQLKFLNLSFFIK